MAKKWYPVTDILTCIEYKTAATALKAIMGAAILLIGFYMFWLAL